MYRYWIFDLDGTLADTSQDIIDSLGNVPFHAKAVKDRDELIEKIGSSARPGDAVIVMGARDPSLPALVKRIIDMFGGKEPF